MQIPARTSGKYSVELCQYKWVVGYIELRWRHILCTMCVFGMSSWEYHIGWFKIFVRYAILIRCHHNGRWTLRINRNTVFFIEAEWCIYVSVNYTIIGSDNGLSPSHYMNQCWNIVNCTLWNELQQNLNKNSYDFIGKNSVSYVVKKWW